jgi:hypothetical protein
MIKRQVRCEKRCSQIWVNLPDLRSVLEAAALEAIDDMACADNQRESDRQEGKRQAYRDMADGLTKYEIQMS